MDCEAHLHARLLRVPYLVDLSHGGTLLRRQRLVRVRVGVGVGVGIRASVRVRVRARARARTRATTRGSACAAR